MPVFFEVTSEGDDVEVATPRRPMTMPVFFFRRPSSSSVQERKRLCLVPRLCMRASAYIPQTKHKQTKRRESQDAALHMNKKNPYEYEHK